MKIGILTLPLETNYGGNLQAFALQKVLRKMGHDVYTIDRHNRKEYPSFFIHVLGFIKRLFLYYVRKKRISIKWNPFLSDSEYSNLSALTQTFINNNINLTRKIYSNQLSEIEDEYRFDAYIVGSDQVWLDKYCPNSFLDFVKRKEVKKIVYAASSGNKSFFDNQNTINKCKVLAKEFDGISVREDTLIDLCYNKLGIQVTSVIDPTMLLRPNEYLLITENQVGNSPIIFSYILDPSIFKTQIIRTIKNKFNYPHIEGNLDKNVQTQYASIDDWIYNIKRAKFIITDSFHGTVFAILFNVPFITIGNKSRGMNRFSSLLKMFKLEYRLLIDDSFNLDFILNTEINFNEVNNILEDKRKLSLHFLEKVLE